MTLLSHWRRLPQIKALHPSQGDGAYESGTLLEGASSEKGADAATIST